MFLFLNIDPRIRLALGAAALVLGIVFHQVFIIALGAFMIVMAAYGWVKRADR